MRRDNWNVAEFGIRPGGKPDECFYCKVVKGNPHRADCVIKSRTVVVRAIAEYVVSVPDDWTEEQIIFQRNEGSWCASNGLREIVDLLEKDEKNDACNFVRYEFVREATVQDEEQFGIKVEDIPS